MHKSKSGTKMKKYQGVYATTTATATRTNGKKAVGLDKQNNNFARASRFFVHFPAVVARLQRETAYFTFCRGREHRQ